MKQILIPIIFTLLFIASFSNFAQNNIQHDVMYAHYINVGQGDATLLEFPCGAILIDAGAQDESYADQLIEYLETFFKIREDLEKKIDVVIVTHAHKDHNLALRMVIEHFNVGIYIDNGKRAGSGKKNQKWLQDNAQILGITYASYTFEQIMEQGGGIGLNNHIIDPLVCDSVDPNITLLAGRFDSKPDDWSRSDFRNGNNQCYAIRVDFGESSFLFTGDTEDDALETLVYEYDGTDILDIDIYQVGHHGSYNATSTELVEEISPYAAIISCGRWNYGLGTGKKHNTYHYGHPRKNVIKELEKEIRTDRSAPLIVKLAAGSKYFEDYTIEERIYATPWDNTIKIRAHENGKFRITRNH